VVTLQVFLMLQENMHKVFVRRIINRAGTYSVIPDGKFLFTLAAALAAWEREILSKRTKEARRLLETEIYSSIADTVHAFHAHEATLKWALDKTIERI